MAEPRPRRGHGEDSIYFDQANNHWVGAVSLGYKAGKRVRKTVTGRTKTAAQDQAPAAAPGAGQRSPVQRDLHRRQRAG
ncbi:MAG TPA: hypothetical protein VKU77_13250 [Streptosporangiaceae bacterium]|nr:hypothetical protein [Streptosporangiaceae bacterium]